MHTSKSPRMNMTAVVDYITPDVQLDRTADADGERNFGGGTNQTGTSGAYPGYDRFGRVVRHMWVDGEFQPFIAPGPGGSLHSDSSKPHIPPIYELTHTYDQASNRLTRDNETATLRWTHRKEAFDYDDLHRVTKAERGSDTSLHSSSRTWDLDMLGNWDSTATWDGTSYGDVESRTHNDANEVESRTPPGAGSPLDMSFDKSGNMLTQEIGDGSTTVTYTYDAWNRLVRVEYNASIRSEYSYNGLNWRVLKRADTSHDGDLDQQRVMYYNEQWQLLEELINASWHDEADPEDHSRRMQYVWGARYIDDIVARQQRDPLGTLEPGALVETWYHLTDTLFSTVAIIDDNATLIERVSYDAYGNARHHRMGDLNGDGVVNVTDMLIQMDAWANYGIGDLNRDGVVNTSDQLILMGNWGAALPAGQLSSTDNIIGYAGYIFNAEVHTTSGAGGGGGLYTVRHRHYVPELGRWLTRDPIGYIDGMSLYEYVRSSPADAFDPQRLASFRRSKTWWGTAACLTAYQAAQAACRLTTPRNSFRRLVCMEIANAAYQACNASVDLHIDTPLITPCLGGAGGMPAGTGTFCGSYPACDSHWGVNFGCMCRCMGNGTWSRCARGCIRCALDRDVHPATAHALCWASCTAMYGPPHPRRLARCEAMCQAFQTICCGFGIENY